MYVLNISRQSGKSKGGRGAVCFGLRAVLAVFVLFAGGCVQEQGYDGPSVEGIKLTDLRAGEAGRPVVQMVFCLYTFEMPVERYEQIKDELASAGGGMMVRYKNQRILEANNVRVEAGQWEQWNGVAEVLKKAGARQSASEVILVFEERAYEAMIVPVLWCKARIVDEREEVKEAVLEDGLLEFELKAGQGGRNRTADVRVGLKFKCNRSGLARRLGKKIREDVVFRWFTVGAELGEGDFIMFRAGEVKAEKAGTNKNGTDANSKKAGQKLEGAADVQGLEGQQKGEQEKEAVDLRIETAGRE